MARRIFILLLLIHGIIHLIGFTKAFGFLNVTAFTIQISKPAGIGWLLAAFLFFSAMGGFLSKKESWPWLAAIAVILSQVLIVFSWRDARWGTAINLFILAVTVVSYAGYRFEKKITSEIKQLLRNAAYNEFDKTGLQRPEDLPPIVKQWLQRSGALTKSPFQAVRLRQKGQLRTKPSGKWRDFNATQYFTVSAPGFIWSVRLKIASLIYMMGRDKLQNNRGEMQMKLMSLLNVVNEGGNEKIDSGSMVRYLAEICWFPAAALQPWIRWDTIDGFSAKAYLYYGKFCVSGVFYFNHNADIIRFSANRYKGSGDKARLERWEVDMLDYKQFGGVRVPYKSKVSWKLKEGDFNWLIVEITDLSYDSYNIYKKVRHSPITSRYLYDSAWLGKIFPDDNADYVRPY